MVLETCEQEHLDNFIIKLKHRDNIENQSEKVLDNKLVLILRWYD